MSIRANYLHHSMHGNYNLIEENYHNAHQHFSAAFQIYKSRPELVEQNFGEYFGALRNMIIVASSLKKYNEGIEYIQELKSLEKKIPAQVNTELMRVRIFAVQYIYELDINIHMGNFARGLSIVPEIENGLMKYKNKMNTIHTTTLYYNISIVYFANNNYSKSLFWLNKILNEPEIAIVPHMHYFSQMFNLIIHYELDNMDLLEHIAKSTYRFLYKRNRLYKLESCILNFIRKKVPQIITNAKQVIAFHELKTELEEITRDPFEKKALEYFDFISWVESKIEDRPFAEIVQEKAGKG